MKPIIFSDVDGTLLTSKHEISDGTLAALQKLEKANIPFVIVSARGPAEISPILNTYDLHCPIIAYSGGLIADRDGSILYEHGLRKTEAAELLSFLEKQQLDLTWGAYSFRQWIVKSRQDRRILMEEAIVRNHAAEGSVSDFSTDAVHKILCFCGPGVRDLAAAKLKAQFPDYTIVPSSDFLLEIMAPGVNKANGVAILCRHMGYSPADALAFGDQQNDMEMLQSVGYGFLMHNAPEALRESFPRITRDNDHDGVAYVLMQSGILEGDFQQDFLKKKKP